MPKAVPRSAKNGKRALRVRELPKITTQTDTRDILAHAAKEARLDNEIIVEAGFLRGVRKNVAGIGLRGDLGQLAHAQSAFAVLGTPRHGLRHGFLRSRAGASARLGYAGKISVIVAPGNAR